MVKRMILKALYKNAVQDELDELLKTENEALEEISETRKQAYELFLKKADLEFSQYQQVKNEAKYQYLLEVLYPSAAEIAEIQGGDVILEIDEEKHIGKMRYDGKDLLSTPGDIMLTEFLTKAMKTADQYIFEGKEALVHLEFYFNLYDTEKVKDCSEEIKNLRQKINTLDLGE